MKFICGNCKEVIRQGNFSKHYASWVPHDKCGYETYFPEHLPGRDKGEPKPAKVRPIGSNDEPENDTLPTSKQLTEAQKKELADKNGPIAGYHEEQLSGWVDPRTHLAAEGKHAKKSKGGK